MSLQERGTRIALGVVTGLLLTFAWAVDLPVASAGRFWSDGATYYAMAWSLAEDVDLRYEAKDLERILSRYPGGPQGLFLKRSSGGMALDGGFPWLRRAGPEQERLHFAKALAYPAAAAPFVRLLGPDRGLLVTNAAFFTLALWLGYGELRRRASPAAAFAAAFFLLFGSAAPLYLVWLTPEAFNLGVVAAGLVAWRRGWPFAAALLLGVAAYSKPTHALLALPLLVEPLLEARRNGSWAGALGEAIRRGAVLGVVVLLGFGATWAATGELNYQGGERKTFYDRYPYGPGGQTFDDSGVWMTTEHLGPLVAGRDDHKQTNRIAPARARDELHQALLRNLGYFWVGRFAGVVPYYAPMAVALLLFLAAGPRERAGWLALLSLLTSALVYLIMIPDNWYGGGGAVGNRYFVSLLPLALFLVPPRREWWVAAGGAASALAFTGPLLASPFYHSLYPGEHATRARFRLFPVELTMLQDLSVFTEVWRKQRPYNGAEHVTPGTLPRAGPVPYFLYFLDDGSYGQESSFGEDGFWLRGGRTAEVILRAFTPPQSVRVVATGGPEGDVVSVRLGRRRERLVLRALTTREALIEPLPRGVGYYGSHVYVLRFSSRQGGSTERDSRELGAFLRLELAAADRATDASVR